MPSTVYDLHFVVILSSSRLFFAGNDKPETDGKVADSYCLFAVWLLLDVYLDTG